MPKTDGTGRNEVRIEWTGPMSREDAHRLLDTLGAEQLQSLQVGLATDQPNEVPTRMLPEDRAPETESASEGQSTTSTAQAPESSEDAQSDSGGTETDEMEPDGTETEGTPRLQGDSDSFNLLRLLRSEGGWLRTKDLRAAIPERWDINEENIGSVLWNLSERELVDKRPFERDKRETEYRVTTLGETALDEAFHRAESSDDVETEPLPEEPPQADD